MNCEYEGNGWEIWALFWASGNPRNDEPFNYQRYKPLAEESIVSGRHITYQELYDSAQYGRGQILKGHVA